MKIRTLAAFICLGLLAACANAPHTTSGGGYYLSNRPNVREFGHVVSSYVVSANSFGKSGSMKYEVLKDNGDKIIVVQPPGMAIFYPGDKVMIQTSITTQLIAVPHPEMLRSGDDQ